MMPQTYQSADNITFYGRTKWLMTDSNKFVPSWRNTCHIIIGCALLFTYVVIHALHKHYGPKKMVDLIVIGLTCTIFFKVLVIFTLYLYFILPFNIDITFETHSLFTVMLIYMKIYNNPYRVYALIILKLLENL